MAAAGLSIDDGLIQPGDFSFESGEAAMRAWLALAEPVTAAIASSAQMALGALHVARDRGVDVPDELSLVSFDDTPVVRFSVPPLPAITQPNSRTAATAADLRVAAAAGRGSRQR